MSHEEEVDLEQAAADLYKALDEFYQNLYRGVLARKQEVKDAYIKALQAEAAQRGHILLGPFTADEFQERHDLAKTSEDK